MTFFSNRIVLSSLLFLYPLAIFLLRDTISPLWLILGVVGVLLLRSLSPLPPHLAIFNKLMTSLSVLVSLALLASYLIKGEEAIFYYPIFMNLSMALLFFTSLFRPPNLIACFALLTKPSLDEKGMRYTRKVTLVWGGFCLLNTLPSYGTIYFGDVSLWALYNGCISYILMGILFLGEYAVRRKVRT